MKSPLLKTFILGQAAALISLVFIHNADGQTNGIQNIPAGTFEGSIERLDPRLDNLIDTDQQMEVLAQGFRWSEGPVWITQSKGSSSGDSETSYLLFSDVPANVMYRWSPSDGCTVYMKPSQFDGSEQQAEQGSNGLFLDRSGNLLVCDHGDRCVYRVNADGTKTKLASHYQDRRFHSPNDLVIDRQGNIYFTDPPYGLSDPSLSELDFFGIFKLDTSGEVTLISKELVRPNGIGLSPDQSVLYVAQSDRNAPVFKAYHRQEDGSFESEGKLFFDSTELAAAGGRGMPDGFAVDVEGNLWATGPGGVLIIAPDGTLLGRILLPQATANCCFGAPDGKTLYITSNDKLGRIETKVKGL